MGSFSGLFDVLQGALAFAIILPVLIAVHELGHFWFARALGMEVDAFAVFVGGVRKTKLEDTLSKPLAPAWLTWTAGLVSLAILLFGTTTSNLAATMAGLALGGVVVPLWVVTRIGALYHLNLLESLGTLVKTWLGACVLYLMANKFQIPNPLPFLGLIALSSLIGILFVYYYPVLHKAEDAPNGHGRIEVDQSLASRLKSDEDVEEYKDDYATRRTYLPVFFRPLLSRKDKRGTEFSLLCWPLGGFAAIRGMHPKEDGSETEIPGGFYSKPPISRLLVLFAGPLFSILFGIAVLTGQFMVTGERIVAKDPVIGSVVKDGPGGKAGLKEGDRFVSVNGKPVKTFFDVVSTVRGSLKDENGKKVGVPVNIVVDRKGEQLHMTVTPQVDKEPTIVVDSNMEATTRTAIQAKLQILGTTTYRPVTFQKALTTAATFPVVMVAGLAQTVAKPSEISKNVGGPATIAQEITEASKRGLPEIVQTAGILSISLGVMNLLPIGPLDGGQMMVALAELFRRGKRLSYRIQMTISTIGALLVVALVLGVITLDIGRFGGR